MTQPDFNRLLGPDGPLAVKPFYEYRSGQIEMAENVYEVLSEGGTLLAEAGTGTGKSLAYLLPSFLIGQRVVVSTRTKALQDQLASKDIPLCSDILGRELHAAVVKGRANYLCRYYWDSFLKEPLLNSRTETKYFTLLREWAQKTKTGDKDEWSGIPETLSFWREINARADRCLGSTCPLFKDCFLVRMRRDAEGAELVVTNHHLLFADLAVKTRWDSAVLPEYTKLIMDEAHEAEDAATSFFGSRASKRMFDEWVRDVKKVFRVDTPAKLSESIEQLEGVSPFFFEMLRMASGNGGNERLPVNARALTKEEFTSTKKRLWTILDTLILGMDSLDDKPEEVNGLIGRLEAWTEGVDFVLEGKDDGFVRWTENRERNVTLGASPIEVGSLLEEHLYARLQSTVFTSATLTTANSFDYLKSRLGLGNESKELSIESPFNFVEQGIFYVPANLPVPSDPAFGEKLIEETINLVSASRGRAFILCTSFRNMNLVAESLSNLDYPVFVQGQESKARLISRFMKEGNAILVATSSFWQGVDVQGTALSLVVIDKIPFAVPSDPIVEARIKRLKVLEQNPFSTYQVPAAAITLKQGMGRLIRSRQDRGAVACLDVRLKRSSYGRVIMDSMPPFRRTDNIEDVEEFFSGERT